MPVALSVSGHERMVNGYSAESGEEKFDLPEAIARFGDILNNKERPLVEIGSRSVAGTSQRGGVRARPDPAGLAWGGRIVVSGTRTVASSQ